MRTITAVLAAVAALCLAPGAVGAFHSGGSAQQRLAAGADAALEAGAAVTAGLGRRASRRPATGDAPGDGVPPGAPQLPAGFGSMLSANASQALRAARANPLFLNFTAMRAELSSMEHEFGWLEREALDALTVAESRAVAAEEEAMVRKTEKVAGVQAANAAKAVANRLRAEVGHLHEQDGVLRYLRGLSGEAARLNETAAEASRRASASQSTRTALRRDAEMAAGAYVGYNMAASSLSYEAVASFLSQASGAQRAAESWRAEAELRALHGVASHLARLKAASEGVTTTRAELKDLYAQAGAAGRLVDLFEKEARETAARSAAATAAGAPATASEAEEEAEEEAVVALAASASAGPGSQATAFNASALARPPSLSVGAVRVLHGMAVRSDRLADPRDGAVTRAPDDIVAVSGLDADLAKLFNQLETAVGGVEGMAAALAAEKDALAAALAAAEAANGPGTGLGSAAGMLHGMTSSSVAALLEALRAALAEAGAQRLSAALDGAASARAWWMSGSAVQAEVGRLNAQADRLAAGRRVLESELERRATRDPAASSPGGAAGPSGAGSAVSSLETSVSVTVLQALLRADPSEGARAAADDEAALRSLLSAGGGTLWHQAAELEDEARRVDEELDACLSEPSQFRPGCEQRLRFEGSRLREEAAKRRAAAAAERAVLERLAAELSSALQECRKASAAKADAEGKEGGEGGKKEEEVEEGCAAVEQAGIASQLHAVSAALAGRRQVEEDWAQRTELQCLWRHRRLALTELVAESLAKPPAGAAAGAAGTPPDADAPSGAAPSSSSDGEGDRLRRLLQVCAAMGRDPLAGAEGAGVVRDCLCPEATASHRLLVKARAEADKAAAAREAAQAVQADAATDAAGARAAAETKEETHVKEALFDYLRGRPEWADIVAKAMQTEEAAAQSPEQAAAGAGAAKKE